MKEPDWWSKGNATLKGYASGHVMEFRNVGADSDYSNSKVVLSEMMLSEVTGLARVCALSTTGSEA